MLLDQHQMGKYTVAIWDAGENYEIRAFKAGKKIKMVELPLVANEEEMLQLFAKGKLEMIDWVKGQER